LTEAIRTLVLGGIRSGKSQWAEQALSDMAHSARLRYIATGSGASDDHEWARRLESHRSRRHSGWDTVESSEVASHLRGDPQSPSLVDDLGGWLTQALDRRGWDGGSVRPDVDDLESAVDLVTAPLVLVSPEVGLTVVPATSAGRRFADELGMLNQRLAQRCDRVVLVVAGQPVWVKR